MSLGLIEKMDNAGKFHTSFDKKYNLAKSDFNKLHMNEKVKNDDFINEFWSKYSPEEREAEYAGYISEMEKNVEDITDKLVEINFTPLDHDTFRENLEEAYGNAIEYNKKNGNQFIIKNDMKIPAPIAPEEQARRKKLATDWERKMTGEMTLVHAQINSSTFFTRKSITRESQIFLSGGTMREFKDRCEIIATGTVEQKQNLFESRLSEVLDFVEEIQEYKSDEEFLKAVEGKRWMLGVFSELDKTKMIQDFGFTDESELSPKLLERWNELRDVAVSLGNLQNRVDQIISPMYAIVNPGDLTEDWVKFIEGAFDDGLEDVIGYSEPEELSNAEFAKMLETEHGRINPLFDYASLNSLENSKGFRKDSIKQQINYVAKAKLGFDKNDIEFYTEQGKKLNGIEEASALIADGKTVKMTNGKLYSTDLSIHTENGTKTPQLTAPSPIVCNKNIHAGSFNKYIFSTGRTLSERDKNFAIEALKTKSDAFYSHNFLWRFFHRADRNLINTIKSGLAEKGVSKTELLIASKGDRMTEKDCKNAIGELVGDFKRAKENSPEKIDAIIKDFARLVNTGKFELLAANPALASIYRQAKEIIPEPEAAPAKEEADAELDFTINSEVLETEQKKLSAELKIDTDPEKDFEPEKGKGEIISENNPEKLP